MSMKKIRRTRNYCRKKRGVKTGQSSSPRIRTVESQANVMMARHVGCCSAWGPNAWCVSPWPIMGDQVERLGGRHGTSVHDWGLPCERMESPHHRCVGRTVSSSQGLACLSPRGRACVSPAASKTSCPILRDTKDFVDERQIKLHGVGDVPTGVTGRLHRLDACKGRGIHRGPAIIEPAMLPWSPALGWRCRLWGSHILHPHHLHLGCTCLSPPHDRHSTVAVCP